MLKLSRNKKKDNDQQAAQSSSPQGITGEGNALRKLAAQALLILLIPLLAGFTYLLTVRDPMLQAQQVDRIASAFAGQQASNIHHLHTRLRQRLERAATSPAALAAIAGQDNTATAAAEATLGRLFPEVETLHLLAIDEMGTAGLRGGESGLRNHIEMDLVRKASQGEPTQPESYQFEGRWLTSIAAPVNDPGPPQRSGVIFATLDNGVLAGELASLDASTGVFSLEQHTGGGAGQAAVIASSGSAAATEFTRRAAVPETSWQVAFTPSESLLAGLAIENTTLLAILGVCILAAAAGLALLTIKFPQKLRAEIDKVTVAADQKVPLALQVPELVPIAKQLRRATLRSLRQRAPSPPAHAPAREEARYQPSSDLTNPMFQSTKMLDEDREAELLELDIASLDDEPMMEAPGGFPDHIFRAYDIRGIANSELTDDMVTNIGSAIGTLAGEQGEQALVVGCDGRTSSARIKSALIRALMGSGRDVIDIGMVCTPLLYFATRHLDCASGVMVTGSHNPAEYNGLKIVLNQQTIAAGGIQDIRERVLAGKFSSGSGRMIREDVVPAYMEEVASDIAIAVPLKIVVDAGNGATSVIAPTLFEELGCEVVPLHCKVDGSFPNHPPDTSNEDNLRDLVRVVQEQQADLGVAFDGDGDRLALVTSSGRIVRSDVLLMLYAQDVVSRNPGADVVFDVKCSRHLTQLITQHGGRPVLWKTGHAFMKEKMLETGALLGGEFSGHMFFGERWYGFDDGMYAAGRLAEILSTHGHSLDEAIDEFPITANTPEILIPIAEQDKFRTMDAIIRGADFPAGKINTLDGLRVDFPQGWGLVRASNTSAALTARFEADSAPELEGIMQEFKAQISLADPNLALPF